MSKNWEIETKQLRSGLNRTNHGETSEAIFLNSGFCYDNIETAEARFDGSQPGFVYSRYSNPTLRSLEERLIELEESAEEACVVGSGMAAVNAAILSKLKAGDHIIASKVLFGSCHYIINEVLPRLGFEVTLVDGKNLDEWEAAFKPNTSLVFIETPANPTLELIDIEAVANLCKKNDAFFLVDNIFATMLYQKPLTLGADAVIYSLTKHIDGQGRTLGGVVLGSKEYIQETVLPFYRHTGPALSPFNAWVVLKALETFKLRVDKMTDNAEAVANALAKSDKIERVIYPSAKHHPQADIVEKQMERGSNMIAFYVKGGKEAAFKFVNNLQVIDISNNLGDARSLITHPATTTHSNIPEADRNAIGITGSLLRLSVGLENADDLVKDIEKALL